jgi:hypothetical protein
MPVEEPVYLDIAIGNQEYIGIAKQVGDNLERVAEVKQHETIF